MAPRKVKPVVAELPPSHLEALDLAGFEVMGWQNKAVRVKNSDGEELSEWLPQDCINWEKRLFIRYRKAYDGIYDFDGWEPVCGHTFGGRNSTIYEALAWFTWLDKQNNRYKMPF